MARPTHSARHALEKAKTVPRRDHDSPSQNRAVHRHLASCARATIHQVCVFAHARTSRRSPEIAATDVGQISFRILGVAFGQLAVLFAGQRESQGCCDPL